MASAALWKVSDGGHLDPATGGVGRVWKVQMDEVVGEEHQAAPRVNQNDERATAVSLEGGQQQIGNFSAGPEEFACLSKNSGHAALTDLMP